MDAEAEIKSQKDYLVGEFREIGERLARMPKMEEFLRRVALLPSVQAEEVELDYFGDRSFSFSLSKPDSLFPRELVKEFHGKLGKTPHHDGKSLDCKGMFDGITVEIAQYRPATCRVVYEDVAVPASIVKRARVICDEEEEGLNEAARR